MIDIITIGELLIDLTQTSCDSNGIDLFAATPGGSPANVAVAAARLGACTAFLGKVGRDSMGHILRNALASSGVDITGLLTDAAPTTLAVAASDNGRISYSFFRGADALLSPDELDEDSVSHAKFLHFSSASLTAGPSRSATIFAARQAHRSGRLISFDPNYRPSLWVTPEDARQWMTIPLPLVDVIKLSPVELEMITGTWKLEEGSQFLADKGISLVLITLGGRGVFYRWQGQTGVVPGVPVQIVDKAGAGDAFQGALLSRLCARGEQPLSDLQLPELEEILSFANRAAAWTCTARGAISAMPTLEQMSACPR